MSVRRLALILFMSALSPAETVRIGIIGDQTYSTNLGKSYETLERAVTVLRGEQPSAVLHTGDLVESSVSPAQYKVLFTRATKLLDGLGCPWHLTPGDHDVNPVGYAIGSSDRSRETLYRELYAARESRLSPFLAHSFDISGYHFIALNSQEKLWADARWGDVFLAGLSAAQLAWLEQDLQTHRKAKGIVVWLHQPLWYQWSGWAPVHQLLRRHHVRAVIAGHFHYNQDEGELDGIRYLVVGATGAAVKPGSRDAGSFQHVTLLDLTPRNLHVRILPLDGGPAPEFATRAAMDRIQALDLVRGELGRFASENPLCVRDGQIVNTTGGPAHLRISAIGNPTDQPLSVSISPEGPFTLEQPRFHSERCGSPSACTLPPAEGVMWSNNSTVALQPKLNPIWEAEPRLSSAGTMPEELALRIRMQLPDGKYLDGIVRTALKSCAP